MTGDRESEAWYWLKVPMYETVHEHYWKNGSGGHPIGMPGISCPRCGPWGGSRILTFVAPREVRQLPALRSRRPLPLAEFDVLRSRVQATLRAEQQVDVALEPGDSFQPLHLRFVRPPQHGVLWPILGNPVVTEPVRRLFEENEVTGLVFREAIVERVGDSGHAGRQTIPATEEPEDLLEYFPAQKDWGGRLFEAVVTSNTEGLEVQYETCSVCGRRAPTENSGLSSGDLLGTPETDVFHLGHTLRIGVSRRVRDLFVANRIPNIDLERILRTSAQGTAH